MTRTRIQQTSLIREVQKITEPFQNKKAAIASGGVSDGTINNTDFFLNTGQILFSVSESEQPQGSLYLRVYTGADYTNDQWKAIGDKEADREIFYQRAAASSSAHGYDGRSAFLWGFHRGRAMRRMPMHLIFLMHRSRMHRKNNICIIRWHVWAICLQRRRTA